MADDRTPGEIAYDTYRDAAELALPAWDALPDAEQEVWADVAFAVQRTTEREPDTVDELLARSGARVDLHGPAPDASDISALDLEDQAAVALEATGLVFSLVPMESDEVAGMVAFLPDDEHCFGLVDRCTGRGFCMTRDTAARLVDTIHKAVTDPFAPWNKPAGPAS